MENTPPPQCYNETKKPSAYRVKKVTRLIDIVMQATVVLYRVISVALKDGIIDEEKFNTLQTLHLKTLN